MIKMAFRISWSVFKWTFILLAGLVVLLAIYYNVENWRGHRAWEDCKRELAAKGESLEWDDFVPPLVPDAKNFYQAPKMQEWFVNSRAKGVTNEFVKHLTRTNESSVVIAEVTLASPHQRTNAIDS